MDPRSILQFQLAPLNDGENLIAEAFKSGTLCRRVSQFYLHSHAFIHCGEKAVSCNSKISRRKLLRLDRNMCYDNDRCGLELLTFDVEIYLRIFPF